MHPELLQWSQQYEPASYLASENSQRYLRGWDWYYLCGSCLCADFSSTKALSMVCSGWDARGMVNRENICAA